MGSDPRSRAQALQCALDEAQQALAAARRRCAEHGLDPTDTRADLERRLSAQELDQVHAAVEARLQEIERGARQAVEPPAARARHPHPSTI